MKQKSNVRPVPQGQIRCVFYGGPLDGRTKDVNAGLPGRTPPRWINAENSADQPGSVYHYVKDGEVEAGPDGPYLRMRYAGELAAPPS